MRLFLLLLFLTLCSGWKEYQAQIPNGDKVPHWHGVGHSKAAGGGSINEFGRAFAKAGNQWTRELCEADTDGDGKTNGDELGDPCCTWQPGDLPMRHKAISHPSYKFGDSECANTQCVTSAPSCKLQPAPAMAAPQVTSLGSNNVRLTWVKPVGGPGGHTGCYCGIKLQLRRQPTTTLDSKWSTVQKLAALAEGTEVTCLDPQQSYEARLLSFNLQGDSDVSPALLFQTKQGPACGQLSSPHSHDDDAVIGNVALLTAMLAGMVVVALFLYAAKRGVDRYMSAGNEMYQTLGDVVADTDE